MNLSDYKTWLAWLSFTLLAGLVSLGLTPPSQAQNQLQSAQPSNGTYASTPQRRAYSRAVRYWRHLQRDGKIARQLRIGPDDIDRITLFLFPDGKIPPDLNWRETGRVASSDVDTFFRTLLGKQRYTRLQQIDYQLTYRTPIQLYHAASNKEFAGGKFAHHLPKLNNVYKQYQKEINALNRRYQNKKITPAEYSKRSEQIRRQQLANQRQAVKGDVQAQFRALCGEIYPR